MASTCYKDVKVKYDCPYYYGTNWNYGYDGGYARTPAFTTPTICPTLGNWKFICLEDEYLIEEASALLMSGSEAQ